MDILTLSDYYLPGYKAGGMFRGLANMVELLGADLRFSVVTRNHDLGDAQPYPGLRHEQWVVVGNAQVHYLPDNRTTLKHFGDLIRNTPHDVLHLNSFFSPSFTIKPLVLRRLGLIPAGPVVVAARGEFSRGALAIKRHKKRVYIALAKAIGLYRDVVWQASSVCEERDIRRWFGGDATVVVAPDLLSPMAIEDEEPRRCEKVPGRLRVVFLSRVARKKNLLGALSALNGLEGDIEFSIYGPVEDPGYWSECEAVVDRLPPNIRVSQLGAVTHDQTAAIFRQHDLFFMPTLGENFGYVILEALAQGCPVLISDQTFWRELERKGIGWDISLDQPERFEAVLRECVEMDADAHRVLARRARDFAIDYSHSDSSLQANRELFRACSKVG